MRRVALAGVLLVAALALAGCESTAPIPTPSPSQLVGTWHNGSDDITFDADGTFSITGMPTGVIAQAHVATGAQPAGALESITGTWRIGTGGTDAGGAPGVQLTFVKPAKVEFYYGLTLIVSSDIPPKLYVFLGRSDSGVRYTFTKQKN